MNRLEEPSSQPLRIGLAGLDNSRVIAFAKLLRNADSANRVPGAEIVAAWPSAPSPDFAMSATRFERFLGELRDLHGVKMLDSLEDTNACIDAWMLEAVDGRGREELFRKLLVYGKPIFVDKPFALQAAEARRMSSMAQEAGVPFMSCSALRYSEGLANAIADDSLGRILGADFHGPMELEPTQPGYFWYGIHTAELLFRTLGAGCIAVTAKRTDLCDTAFAEWEDGRVGTVRGFRSGRESFGGHVHRERGTQDIPDLSEGKSYLATLMEEIITFFRTGVPGIPPAETIEIIRFLEAANESVESGRRIML
jgi:predicted dehydrogenase